MIKKNPKQNQNAPHNDALCLSMLTESLCLFYTHTPSGWVIFHARRRRCHHRLIPLRECVFVSIYMYIVCVFCSSPQYLYLVKFYIKQVSFSCIFLDDNRPYEAWKLARSSLKISFMIPPTIWGDFAESREETRSSNLSEIWFHSNPEGLYTLDEFLFPFKVYFSNCFSHFCVVYSLCTRRVKAFTCRHVLCFSTVLTLAWLCCFLN